MRHFLFKIAIVLLIPVILWKTCSSGIIYVRYIIQKEYVAQTFCINKDKPKMQCDGKCHLKKQLDEDEKKDHFPSGQTTQKDEIQFFTEREWLVLYFVPVATRQQEERYTAHFSDTHLHGIFHPPRV